MQLQIVIYKNAPGNIVINNRRLVCDLHESRPELEPQGLDLLIIL